MNTKIKKISLSGLLLIIGTLSGGGLYHAHAADDIYQEKIYHIGPTNGGGAQLTAMQMCQRDIEAGKCKSSTCTAITVENGPDKAICYKWYNQEASEFNNDDGSFVFWLLSWLFTFIAYVFKVILIWIFDVIEYLLDKAFDIPHELQNVWEYLRDFVNVVFAVILIGIAVMNILRIKLDNYAVKKALPGVILGLVLVNLSWVMCTLVLDVGQVLYHVMLNIYPNGVATLHSLVDTGAIEQAGLLQKDAGMFSTTGNMALWSFANMVIFFLLIVPSAQLLFVLFVRVIVLWLLFVISPLAWIGFVVPEARADTWGKFWSTLITMVIMPAKVALYFVIGIMVKDSLLMIANTGQEKGVATLPDHASAGLSTIATQMGTNAGVNGISVVDAIFIIAISVACITIAARDAMKSEFTEAAMNIGGKVGKWIQRGAGAVVMTPFTLAAKGLGKAGKKGYEGLKNSRTGEAMRKNITFNRDKAWAWADYDNERNRIEADPALLHPEKKKKISDAAEARDRKIKGAHKSNTFITARDRAENDLAAATRQADAQLDQAKMNWVNAGNPANQWEQSADYQTAKQTRDDTVSTATSTKEAAVSTAQKEYDDKVKARKDTIKAIRTPFTELGTNFATHGSIAEGAKKVVEAWKGNMDSMKEADSLAWAKRIANVGKVDITGTLKASGLDVKGIKANLQLKLDNDYSKHIRDEKYRDLLNIGTRQQILSELENLKDEAAGGGRYAQIAMENLLHTLEQKHATFMDEKESLRLEKIYEQIIDNQGTDKALVRDEFANTTGDRVGTLRARNINFSNAVWDPKTGQVVGFRSGTGDRDVAGNLITYDPRDPANKDKRLYKDDGLKPVLDPSKMSVNGLKEASAVSTLQAVSEGKILIDDSKLPLSNVTDTMGTPWKAAQREVADDNLKAFNKVATENQWYEIGAKLQLAQKKMLAALKAGDDPATDAAFQAAVDALVALHLSRGLREEIDKMLGGNAERTHPGFTA